VSDNARRLRARFYARAPSDWQVYHQVVAEHLMPSVTVLDVGAGKGIIAPFPWADYPDVRLIGLDPDPFAAQNPSLHSFRLLENDADWPVEDGAVDIVLARYVLEHVSAPATFFANVQRVLAPGGRFIFLTPNKHHPMMIASRHLPHAIKTRILARTSGTASSDVFVTWYSTRTPQAGAPARSRGGALGNEGVPASWVP